MSRRKYLVPSLRARSVMPILIALAIGQIAAAGSVTYHINARGQVDTATYDNGTTIAYTYDAAGNRISAVVTPDTSAPGAPGTPTASNITGTTATVNWTAATDNIGVTGYSYQLNGGAWSGFSSSLSVNLTGLAYGTHYIVAVRAEDAALNIGPAATGSFSTTPDTTPPSAPGTPTASNVTGTSATVSWAAATDNVGATGYSYQINGGSWSTFSPALSVNLTGLSLGTNYIVGVRAEDAALNIGPAATGSFTTIPDSVPPGAPGTPTASSITGTSATVSWAAATDNVGVTGYSYQLNGGAWSTFSASLSVSLTGLTNGTHYNVGVRAEDAASNIGPAATGSFTTTDTALPGAPGTPTASSITGTSATVSWAAATDNVGVTGYSYQLNGGAWSTFSASLSVSLTGLTNGTHYTVGVRAEDAALNIGPAATGSFSTIDTTPPGSPGVPTATNVVGTTATLSWTAATDNVGVTGYTYQLNGGSWVSVGNVLSVNLTGLAGGTTSYTFAVRAQDAAGNPGTSTSLTFQALYHITDAGGSALTSLYTSNMFVPPVGGGGSFWVTQTYGSRLQVRLDSKVTHGTCAWTNSTLATGYSTNCLDTYASYAAYGH